MIQTEYERMAATLRPSRSQAVAKELEAVRAALAEGNVLPVWDRFARPGQQELGRQVLLAYVTRMAEEDTSPSVFVFGHTPPAMRALEVLMSCAGDDPFLRLPKEEAVFLARGCISHIEHSWFHARYAAGGCKTYEVSLGLAEHLAHTELRGLAGDDLHAPFSAFSILVPPTLFAEAQQNKVDDGSFVKQISEVTVVECADDSTKGPGGETLRWWSIRVVAATQKEGAAEKSAAFHFTVPLLEKFSIEETLKIVQSSNDTTPSLIPTPRIWQTVFRWVMNIVLYTQCGEVEIEPYCANKEYRDLADRLKTAKGTKREKVKLRLREVEPNRRLYLGRGIKADDVRRQEEDRARRTGTPLAVRVQVSGYWKKQPYGPKQSLRRLQWVRPYVRGAELVPESNPRRIVV